MRKQKLCYPLLVVVLVVSLLAPGLTGVCAEGLEEVSPMPSEALPFETEETPSESPAASDALPVEPVETSSESTPVPSETPAVEPTEAPSEAPDATPAASDVPTAEPSEMPSESPVATSEPTSDQTDDEPSGEDGAADSEPTLFDRLMACTALDELFSLLEETPEEELLKLTAEEWAQIECRIAELEPEPLPPVVPLETGDAPVLSQIIRITVNFDDVAPFGAPVLGDGE